MTERKPLLPTLKNRLDDIENLPADIALLWEAIDVIKERIGELALDQRLFAAHSRRISSLERVWRRIKDGALLLSIGGAVIFALRLAYYLGAVGWPG